METGGELYETLRLVVSGHFFLISLFTAQSSKNNFILDMTYFCGQQSEVKSTEKPKILVRCQLLVSFS